MKIMNEGNITLSQPWRDFYNNLAWVLLDLNEPQFVLAWKLWRQHRQEKHGAQPTRATALLKRMH